MNTGGRTYPVVELCYAQHGKTLGKHCITCQHLKRWRSPGQHAGSPYCEESEENEWGGWDPNNETCGRRELCDEAK